MEATKPYGEEELKHDMKEMSKYFRDIFNREMSRIRENLSTDYRMPREGWDVPYNSILSICRRMGRDPHALTKAMEDFEVSLQALKDTAENEMVTIQSQVAVVLDGMDQVR